MPNAKNFVFVVAWYDNRGKLHDDTAFYLCVDNVITFAMHEYDDKPAVIFQLDSILCRFITHNIKPFDSMLRGDWKDWTEYAEQSK